MGLVYQLPWIRNGIWPFIVDDVLDCVWTRHAPKFRLAVESKPSLGYLGKIIPGLVNGQ